MATININADGETHTADIIDTVLEHDDAIVHIVDVDGNHFAAVVYRDGTIITSSDWQGTCDHHNRETVLAEIGDPAWAHHWMRASDLHDCVIIDGLPRVLE